MRKISYGSLKLFKECPACFWWQVNKGIRRLNPWQSNLPNVIEKHILDVFEDYRNSKKLPLELDIPELKDFRLIESELHKKWKNQFSDEPSYEDLTANPDDVLTNGKEWIVLDIKTIGKFPENCTKEAMEKEIEEYDYRLQLEFYSYILRNCGYATPDYGYILFYFIDKGEKNGELKLKYHLVHVKLNINQVKNLIERARKILKKDKAPKCSCDFCSSHKQRYKDFLKEQERTEELGKEILKM